jgi:hypothetical protein
VLEPNALDSRKDQLPWIEHADEIVHHGKLSYPRQKGIVGEMAGEPGRIRADRRFGSKGASSLSSDIFELS